MRFQKILIPIDGSPLSAHAAEVGIELARSLGGEVALVHVVDPAGNTFPEGGVSVAELVKLDEEEAKRLLADFRSRVTLDRPPLEFLQVGKPATEIVKAAQEWPADMIAIGSHGRGGVSRLLFGSVAEGVMRHACCPVLVVRAPA